jgi:CBS domain-containing protein
MNVGRICTREVESIGFGEFVGVAAKRMAEKGVGTLAVVDGEGRPVGILTDRDLALRVLGAQLHPDQTLVEDVMSAHPRTVYEGTTLEEALECMRDLGVRRLPVVGAGDVLVGLISIDDVVEHLVREFEQVGQVLHKSASHGPLQV